MCYFNRLTRVARWLADYPEWLQFCWDFVKPPRNDEICNNFFFLLAAVQDFFLFHLCCMQFFTSKKCLQEFFFQNHPSPLRQELNGRPLSAVFSNKFFSLESHTIKSSNSKGICSINSLKFG